MAVVMGSYNLLLILFPVSGIAIIYGIVYAARKRKAGGKKARVSPAKHERLTRLFRTAGVALTFFAILLAADMWYTTQKAYDNAWATYPQIMKKTVRKMIEKKYYYEHEYPDFPKYDAFYGEHNGIALSQFNGYTAVVRAYLQSDDTEMARLNANGEFDSSFIAELLDKGGMEEIITTHAMFEKSFSDFPRLLENMPSWYVRYHDDMIAFAQKERELFEEMWDAYYVLHGLVRASFASNTQNLYKNMPQLDDYYTAYYDAVYLYASGGQTRKSYATACAALALRGYELWDGQQWKEHEGAWARYIYCVFEYGEDADTTVFGIDTKIAISLLLGVCVLSGLALYTGAEKRALSKAKWLYAVWGALALTGTLLMFATLFVGQCVAKIFYLEIVNLLCVMSCIATVGSGILLAVCMAIGKIAAICSRKNASSSREDNGSFCFALGMCAAVAGFFAVYIAAGLWAAANVLFGASGVACAAYTVQRQKKVLFGQKACLIIGGVASGIAIVFAAVTAATRINLYAHFPLLATAAVFFILGVPQVRALLTEPAGYASADNAIVYESTCTGKGYARVARKKRTRRG